MAIPGSETDTLGTIAITILPSFLTNFSGRAVRIKLAMEGSSVASAAAGKDSGAVTNAPSGAVNQGTIDEKTWKYGHAFDPPPNAKIWNPVKLKLMRGEKVTGGTVSSSSDPSTYCTMANAGYDFIWMEMQHSPRDWENVAKMWQACPHAKAVPGVRVAYADEREIQHAMDAGALVIVIPTVRTVEEGKAGRVSLAKILSAYDFCNIQSCCSQAKSDSTLA